MMAWIRDHQKSFLVLAACFVGLLWLVHLMLAYLFADFTCAGSGTTKVLSAAIGLAVFFLIIMAMLTALAARSNPKQTPLSAFLYRVLLASSIYFGLLIALQTLSLILMGDRC